MRNELLAGAAVLAALTAACRRAPPPADPSLPANAVTLSTPAPAGVGLGPETSSYTNEMQAENLRSQAAQLGIERLTRPSDQAADPEDSRPMIDYEEGLERTREMSRQFEAQRHIIEKDKRKSVTLPSSTPGILPGKKEGAPVEPAPDAAAPAPSADDPKGPENK